MDLNCFRDRLFDLLNDRWLERAGFNAGDKITVDCQQGRLAITKDEPEADTETG